MILPSYSDKIYEQNIGALQLEKNQKKYYEIYFIALLNKWQYFPYEKELTVLRGFYKKYYGEKLTKIYIDAVEKNRERFK